MKLLKITEKYEEEFEEHFDEVKTIKIEEITPEVISKEPDAKIHGEKVSQYDAAFLEIPKKNAVFGRVLLETIEEQGVITNYPSTAFFTTAKKNQLYPVLHSKEIPAPKTAVIADSKAVRNIERYLKGPLIARRFENLEEIERTFIDEVEQIKKFAEGLDYGDELLIFSEFVKGDKYKCLYAGERIISLKDSSEGRDFQEDSLKYSSLSSDLEELVEETCKKIGIEIAEVVIRGEKVVDINPNPDLELYTEKSGKDAFKNVVRTLKEE